MQLYFCIALLQAKANLDINGVSNLRCMFDHITDKDEDDMAISSLEWEQCRNITVVLHAKAQPPRDVLTALESIQNCQPNQKIYSVFQLKQGASLCDVAKSIAIARKAKDTAADSFSELKEMLTKAMANDVDGDSLDFVKKTRCTLLSIEKKIDAKTIVVVRKMWDDLFEKYLQWHAEHELGPFLKSVVRHIQSDNKIPCFPASWLTQACWTRTML
jgi:hypothetical protein